MSLTGVRVLTGVAVTLVGFFFLLVDISMLMSGNLPGVIVCSLLAGGTIYVGASMIAGE